MWNHSWNFFFQNPIEQSYFHHSYQNDYDDYYYHDFYDTYYSDFDYQIEKEDYFLGFQRPKTIFERVISKIKQFFTWPRLSERQSAIIPILGPIFGGIFGLVSFAGKNIIICPEKKATYTKKKCWCTI